MATIDLSNFKNKKVLVIFPHPDDETVVAGGLIQRLIGFGAKVSVVSLTSGDQGKIHIHGRGLSLGEIRRHEFFKAVQRLGVTNYEIFNFPDGKLKDTKVWHPVIDDYIRHYDLVITYDPSGVTGHPDHIALSLQLMKLAIKTEFKFLQIAPIGLIKKSLMDSRVAKFATAPDLIIELSLLERLRKWSALSAHRSQYQLSTLFLTFFISFLPQSEGFSIYNPKKKYPFKFIPFKF